MNMCTRRDLMVGSLAAVAGTTRTDLQLIDDARFARGCVVWRPEPGRKVKAGTLLPIEGRSEPVWGLAQWHSRFSLASAKPERLASGAVKFFDGAKTVIFGPASTPEADLILGLDGFTEYEGRAPQPGDAWPHLLMSNKLAHQAALSSLEAVRLQASYRLRASESFQVADWNSRRHTAQFLLYLTVQNLNRESRGFGDYYWFGVQMYDARYRFPAQYAAKDAGTLKKAGTGKFIFNPATERFTTKSAHDREWITIDKDLLPLIREGLETAWDRGYLPDSHDLRDYQLAGITIGWEITGTLNAAVQVRSFGLQAAMRS